MKVIDFEVFEEKIVLLRASHIFGIYGTIAAL
jgi:hypothetical protein